MEVTSFRHMAAKLHHSACYMVDAVFERAHSTSKPESLLCFEGGWAATVYRSWDFPDRILQAWDELAHQYGDIGIFLESGWFEQWWRAMGQKGELFVTVVEQAGRVAGIFPCWIAPGGRVQALADGYHYDFLFAESQRERTLDCFIQAVLRHTNGSAYFHWFPRTSNTPVLLKSRFQKKLIPVGTYACPYAPFIDLATTSWVEYTASLHSKLKNNLRKGRKRAEQEGELSFAVITQSHLLNDVMTELFDVEYRSWKGAQGTAIRCSEDTESLYRGVAQWAMKKGCLYIFTLRLNGRLIAFDLCVSGGRTLFAMKTGYDQELAARFSPGNLMRYRLIEYLFQTEQFDRYDFLGPFYPWKREWTSQANTSTSVEIYPRTVSGWGAYLRKYGWKEPLRRLPYLDRVAKKLRGR